MTSYPPPPWQLTGHAYVSMFAVPLDVLPRDLPAGTRPVHLGGFALVGAAWFVYDTAGDLAYDEVMVTLLVRRRWRLFTTVTSIWVNSPASRDGGRALWGIPKQLAEFNVIADREYGARAVAVTTVRSRRSLPGRWTARFHVAQDRDGDVLLSPVRMSARIAPASLSWRIPFASPIGPGLNGRRPLVSLGLRELRMSFGRRP